MTTFNLYGNSETMIATITIFRNNKLATSSATEVRGPLACGRLMRAAKNASTSCIQIKLHDLGRENCFRNELDIQAACRVLNSEICLLERSRVKEHQ